MASLPITDEPEGVMDDSELVSVLAQHAAQAIGYQPGGDDEISAAQEQAINYYYRIMEDVPAQEGCSSVVDGTVQTVIDNALAAILKPFVGSDETVKFAPRSEEDIPTADQATEYVNYVFNYDNPGFTIIHDWAKDGLLTKLGVVKVWWEAEPREESQQVQLENDLHAQMIRMDPNYMGEQDGVATVGQVIDDGRVKIANIPPEEFRLSPFSRSIETAIYAAHVPTNVTRSDVMEMGFDAEIVEGLPAYGGGEDGTLQQARYQDENFSNVNQVSGHPSLDIISLRDEYIRIDYDGDGIAELRRIVRVDNTVLLNEEVEQSPFAVWCPIPMPHKVFGLSLADLIIELQKINTVLWRQTLDNLYKSNNPRPVVAESGIRPDGSTQETLSDSAPGAEILVQDINGFRFDAVPFTAQHSLPMFELVGNMVEERTGISRTGQGLDTNALRKAGQMTATEMAMISSGKNARVEMMARIFAETGVKRLFKLILHLITRHQPRERMIRLRNQWVPVDPRGWPEMDLEVSVGLGVGEKTEQIAVADGVLETMAQLGQSPFASLIGPDKVYNAVKRKFTAAGIKNTDEYLNEPQEGMAQEQPPSPEMMKAQAELQLQQAKLQGDQQAAAMKLDHERQMGEIKLQLQAQEQAQKQQLAREQAEFEAQLAAAKAEQESALAQQKMAMELDLAERRMALEAGMAQHKAKLAQDANEAKLSTNRPGGDLDK